VVDTDTDGPSTDKVLVEPSGQAKFCSDPTCSDIHAQSAGPGPRRTDGLSEHVRTINEKVWETGILLFGTCLQEYQRYINAINNLLPTSYFNNLYSIRLDLACVRIS